MNSTINIMEKCETLDYIISHKCNVSRLGDGEIDIINGLSIAYQSYDPGLSKDLHRILLKNTPDSLLVCLPDVFAEKSNYTSDGLGYIKKYSEAIKAHLPNNSNNVIYGNTNISRFYFDFRCSPEPSEKVIEKLKLLWNNKDILIVEGSTTRSGIGNDLYSNAKSISRIICPSKNAYSCITEIESSIVKYGKNKLVILMLGPTAKSIALHMCDQDIWAIDLGHLDSEYEWYKMKAKSKIKLVNKHTAEFNLDEDVTDVSDSLYYTQIVDVISSEDTLIALEVAYNRNKKIIDLISENNDAPLEILDVGCGIGTLMDGIKYKYPNTNVHGIDSNNDIVTFSRRNNDVICGDFESMNFPFRSETFDCIIFSNVLEYFKNPIAALERIRPYLKQDGKIIVKFNNAMNIKIIMDLIKGHISDYSSENGIIAHHFTENDVTQIISRAGYIPQFWIFTFYTDYMCKNEEEQIVFDAICNIPGAKDANSYNIKTCIITAKRSST